MLIIRLIILYSLLLYDWVFFSVVAARLPWHGEESQWDRPCTFPLFFFLVHAVLSLSDLNAGLVDKWSKAVGNSMFDCSIFGLFSYLKQGFSCQCASGSILLGMAF